MQNQKKLSIREIQIGDIEKIISYWRDTSADDLARLGETTPPNESENRIFLQWFHDSNPSLEEASEDIIIWEVEGEAVGYSTLKQVKLPDYGQLHIHMWSEEMRGKGFGALLFCLSALHFRTKYRILNLYCRPKADNQMPNRMLKKIGFPTTDSPECLERIYEDGRTVPHIKYYLAPDVISSFINTSRHKFTFIVPEASPVFTFETARLRGRKIERTDFSLLHDMNQNISVMATLGGVCDKEETRRRLYWNLQQWTSNGFGLYFFFEKATGKFVGRGGIRRLCIDNIDEVEIAYALMPDFWGKGLATEIAKECVSLGFEHYAFRTLVAGTQATNKASQRVITKAGFSFEKEVFQFDALQFIYRQVNPRSS